MNTVAHKLIMRSHQTGRDFATIDETAMSELLAGGDDAQDADHEAYREGQAVCRA